MEVYGKVFTGPNIVAPNFEKAEEAAKQTGLIVVGELDTLVVNEDNTLYPSTIEAEDKRTVH